MPHGKNFYVNIRSNRFSCPHCNKVYSSSFSLALHKRTSHPESWRGEDKDGLNICGHCRAKFPNQRILGRHIGAKHFRELGIK